jgi:NADH-quinone oxidoreductase subunit H
MTADSSVNYWIVLAKIFLPYTIVLITATWSTWAERRIVGFIQDRVGPNRVGPFGLLQPIADALKSIFKEDLVPDGVNRFLYTMGPLIIFCVPMILLAVVPFAEGWAIVDFNVGVLYILAIGGLTSYGVLFGGWASNNKYGLLSGLRDGAQLIAYELALALTIISVIMTTQSVHLDDIIQSQNAGLFHWNAFRQPLAFILFVIAAFAETNKVPFDTVEGEPEIVGGYQVEYSGFRWAAIMFGETIAYIVMSLFISILFCGGYAFPGINIVNPFWNVMISALILSIKMCFWIFVFIWVKWTIPRFRYDQIVRIGWLGLVPLALLNIVITALVTIK